MLRLLQNLRLSHFSGIMVLSLMLLSGCAFTIPVSISDPVSSSNKFSKTEVLPTKLYFADNRLPEDKTKLTTGRVSINLFYKEQPLDATGWLARNTVEELKTRGLPVTQASSADGATTVQIKFIGSQNYRASGFSPFETYTSLNADLVTAKGVQRIAFWIKRGKVPVWSFNEVVDPTFNGPFGVMSKELAAKINQHLFGASISDAQVDALVRKIEAADGSVVNDVFELGFGNNPRAVPALVKLVHTGGEEVAHAAMSSLGVLRANEQLPLLEARFENTRADWEDRAIALKAICDLDADAAKAYVKKLDASLAAKTDRESTLFKAVMALYK